MMNGTKINLNIYYSSICNMNCSYCCAGSNNPEENDAIRIAIQNGSFQQQIINWCHENEPITLGIWGREPTLNQDLWEDFIIPILENCSSIKGIFVSTNGIEFNAHAWLDCLYTYCETNHRKIKLWIQFSIDGPQYDDRARQNLLAVINTYTASEWFRIKLSTKSTLTANDLRTNIVDWYSWMNNLKNSCETIAIDGCDISLIGNYPTLERPGHYSKEDGIYWSDWGPDHGDFISDKLPLTCAAGKTSWTIDYQGIIYDCPLKKNRISKNDEPFTFQEFMNVVRQQFINYHIEQYWEWYRVYRIILSQWCWATSTIEDLPSYLNVWCNDAITEGE